GPNDTSLSNYLYGITCRASTDCWAVGTAYNQPAPFIAAGTIVVEHYDGSSWSLVSTPTTTAAGGVLYNVACVSGNDCWAAGSTFTGLVYQTLIEHYDGTAWSITSSPNSSNEENFLYGITCTGVSDCWAVGYDYTQDAQLYRTLIEHYDGSSWSIVTSPNGSSQSNYFQAVTCAGAGDCWAVGYYTDDADANIFTLTEYYDGTSWQVVNTPNPRSKGDTNDLQAITCLSSGNCWAVGYSYDFATTTQYTLIEHYTVPARLSAVVSRKVHGTAGSFDIDLTNGSGLECRTGGTSGNYTLVFAFADTLTSVGDAALTTGSGSVSSSGIDPSDAHNYLVNLTGVANAQRINVTLSNVTDSAGDFSSETSASMGVLVGDTNGDGVVNSADISQVKSQSGQTLTATNFRDDVTVDGFLNSADISLVKARSGTALP
ncbi:MAG: dockerin type I repeat-containing protein, partial [Verrucomicrobia bacterium]|nr:dockerin type I repeat-containing protein [Verrucomicrobiota bacterium]